MTIVSDRVAAGAAYLDEHDPDWHRADVPNAISLDRLDMGIGDACILGQRCPLETLEGYLGYTIEYDDDREFGYHAYANKLHHGFPNRDAMETWAISHGFQAGMGAAGIFRDVNEYDALAAEWRRVIEARRAS